MCSLEKTWGTWDKMKSSAFCEEFKERAKRKWENFSSLNPFHFHNEIVAMTTISTLFKPHVFILLEQRDKKSSGADDVASKLWAQADMSRTIVIIVRRWMKRLSLRTKASRGLFWIFARFIFSSPPSSRNWITNSKHDITNSRIRRRMIMKIKEKKKRKLSRFLSPPQATNLTLTRFHFDCTFHCQEWKLSWLGFKERWRRRLFYKTIRCRVKTLISSLSRQSEVEMFVGSYSIFERSCWSQRARKTLLIHFCCYSRIHAMWWCKSFFMLWGFGGLWETFCSLFSSQP